MKQKTKTTIWTVIAVIILIGLLLLWLTEAMSVGDDDVSAPLTFLQTVGNVVMKWDKNSIDFSIVKYVLLSLLFVLSVCAVMISKYQPFLYFQF